MMNLDKLLTVLGLATSDRRAVTGLAFDSRKVEAGFLFVALPGTELDGFDFIDQAVARGACAVISEKAWRGSVPNFIVDKSRRAIGLLAHHFYRQPSNDINVIGVTGTNGKTTTTYLIYHILKSLGRRPSLLGTVCNDIAGHRESAWQTTPDVLSLHESAAKTRACGGQDMVIEVSSHALDQDRTAGLKIQVGAFTNLSQDHLDYHGSLAKYRRAKGRLFESLTSTAVAVLNAHDQESFRFARDTRAKILKYGIGDRGRLRAEVARMSLAGMELVFSIDRQRCRHQSLLVGRYNVENLLAALGVVISLGVDLEEALGALVDFSGVPGRLERVSKPDQPAVFVDYAHTDDALDRVLSTLRPLIRGRLIVVFGCGGDRDRIKRPLMAKVAARWADRIYLTSDNPRSEDPQQIANDTVPGFGASPHHVILDRQQAIDRAIADADLGDIVVIAGKGHEDYQVIGDRRIEFDDREMARDSLSRYHSTSPRCSAVA
jgi:UDP-N-acetylmuramoyl-L-alanyl-D-glutamate--2,6-diaminopimelate ligase